MYFHEFESAAIGEIFKLTWANVLNVEMIFVIVEMIFVNDMRCKFQTHSMILYLIIITMLNVCTSLIHIEYLAQCGSVLD